MFVIAALGFFTADGSAGISLASAFSLTVVANVSRSALTSLFRRTMSATLGPERFSNVNVAANRRLNEIYTGALNTLNHPGPSSAPYDPEIPKRLILAERARIVFRDAECNYKSMIAHGGTGEGYVYVACL